jgi:hypothetical protein
MAARMANFTAIVVLCSVAAFVAPSAATLLSKHLPVASGLSGKNCVIKGNVSFKSGERIYHVPGQQHYDETVISPAYGERWFCSEVEARAAGWRKAGR